MQAEGKSAAAAKSVLTDDRFAQIFTDPEFAVETLPLSKGD